MRFFFYLIIALSFSGCGLLQQSREPAHYSELRKQNRDPLHVYSCGPEALHKALSRFGIEISEHDLSHAIQAGFECNTLIRDFAAVFVNEARRITFPEEMLYVLKENGFKVSEVKKLEDLDEKTDTAIVLIKEKGTLNYHWVCFPSDKNILTFFGIDTSLKEIYLISK
jgi:hypothetical protein